MKIGTVAAARVSDIEYLAGGHFALVGGLDEADAAAAAAGAGQPIAPVQRVGELDHLAREGAEPAGHLEVVLSAPRRTARCHAESGEAVEPASLTTVVSLPGRRRDPRGTPPGNSTVTVVGVTAVASAPPSTGVPTSIPLPPPALIPLLRPWWLIRR